MAVTGYEQYAESNQPSEADFRELNNLLDRWQKTQLEVEEAEAALRSKQKLFSSLDEVKIPELMARLQLQEFVDIKGRKVSVKETLRASVTKAKKPQVIKWLEENEHGGMVKRNVVVDFGKDQEAEVAELVNKLRETYPNTRQDQDVNTSSLKALINELLRNGEPVPMELFGAYHQKSVKLAQKGKN